MQKLSSLVGRLAVVVTGALALGACNRAEYAMLPRSASYMGSKTVASTARMAAPVAPQPEVAAPEAPVAVAPVAAIAPAPTVAPTAPVALAAKPAATVAPAPVAAVEASVATPPVKPNFAQRVALQKVSKKLNKLAAKSPQFKQRDATAETARISGNLRTGLILLLIGLIVGLFNGLIGTIIALIGVVFLVLWLLDEL